MKATVMGAGSCRTTFAQVLCDAGTPAVLYARRPETAKAITQDHENPAYLPGISLTPALAADTDPAEAPVREAAAVLASRSAKPEWYGV